MGYPLPPVVRGPLRQGPWPQKERQTDRGGAEDHQWPTLRQLAEENRRAPQGGRGCRFPYRAIRPGPPLGSRPGQTGRCDGYILEGKELDFYVRKLKAKKTK